MKTRRDRVLAGAGELFRFLLLLCTVTAVGCTTGALEKDPAPADKDPSTNQVASKSNSGSLSTTSDDIIKKDVIRPGDQLQIMVWGYPEFNTTATVKEYGTVTVPLVGEVMAAGLTTDDFKEAIKGRLTEYVKGDPRVTVSHIEMSKRISVVGAVTKQDNYPVLTDISLIEIIAQAGGPTSDADLRHVKIFRNGNRRDYIEVDLSTHLENGDLEDLPKVRPGDTVFVPREDNLFRDLAGFAQDILLLFGFFRLLG